MKIAIVLLLSVLLSAVTFAQNESGEVKTITLSSPYVEDEKGRTVSSEKAHRNCFDLVTEAEVLCGKQRWDLVFGNVRIGEQWDWFMVGDSRGVRTRIVGLGKQDWSDEFNVPTVAPFPKLKPGETRAITVDASGHDGAKGSDGNSPGGGAVDHSSYSLIEPPTVESSTLRPIKTSEHLIRAVKGKMYVVHVKDDQNDFYVLMRVDEIVRGRTATLSWKRIQAPGESGTK